MEKAIIRNVRIAPSRFRNFEGRETQYNRAGDRNFVIFLDANQAEELQSEGWPVRWVPDRYNEGEQRAQMKVNVKYYSRQGTKLRPPTVVLITSKGQTKLDENTIQLLDTAEIEKADISLNPYEYDTPQGRGVSAYLRTLYVTIAEDEFANDYSDAQTPAYAAAEELPF